MENARPRSDGAFGYALEVATAVHDLRNRLSVAGCEVQQLRRRLSATPDASGAGVWDCLEAVEHSLAHTNSLLECLLETAYGQTSVRLSTRAGPRTLDLVCLVKQLVAWHDCSGNRQQVALVVSVTRLEGDWDETKLTFLVRTLLTNAVQYSPAGNEVLVTLDRQADEAVLRVADHGIGIPAADLPRIFEPFFRAPNAERVAPGLGLGLATARLIVEQYGGSLAAESTEDVGSTLTARLPLGARES